MKTLNKGFLAIGAKARLSQNPDVRFMKLYMKNIYILACSLLLCAVILDIVGKIQYSAASRYRAQSLSVSHAGQEKAMHNSKAALALGNRLTKIGMTTAACGFLIWIAAAILRRFKGRKTKSAIPLALSAVYALLHVLCV